ncbi:hypothetical protein ATL51_3433 [Pseudonocardia alni]|uniref:DNA-binding transcriptional regulator of glucitol operon n=2 Tax=Pseudonocardia alni TaxID=33907 RepID=A0AA44UQX1_PSEA5|nr:hypothetical protein ATL51_3433 [Pseudonocardia alni]
MTERSSGPGRRHAGVRTLVGVMRLLLSPRWMVWHVLTLGAMVACTWLAIWQWGRAGSAMGSALNVGYGLQWPLFAVFFGVMWWRFLSMEIADLRAAGAAGPGGTAGKPDRAPSATEAPVAGSGTPIAETVPSAAAAAASASTSTAEPAVPAPPAGPSPFTSRPANAAPPRSTDPQLRAYNEELARLAARHREESTP